MTPAPDLPAARTGRPPLDPDALRATASRLGTFSYASLAAAAHISTERATRFVRGLLATGEAEAAGSGDRHRRLFRLVAGAPRQPAAPGSVHGNLWRAMRMLQGFSPVDLAAHAATPTVAVSPEDAAAYCQTLTRAGYLRVVRKAAPPLRPAIYRLVRNTGPLPPVLRRVRAVIDGNTGQIVHVGGIGGAA